MERNAENRIENGPRPAFDVVITPRGDVRGEDARELWKYRDMVRLMVRRDWVAGYKQTILGPAWAVIQPVISTLISVFIFGRLARLSPEGVPMFLFFLSGQALWNFFAGCLNRTTRAYIDGAHLMSKVYFPRIVLPVAGTLSGLISFAIQAGIFTVLCICYNVAGIAVVPHPSILLLPLYMIHLALLGIGTGGLLCALTTKYRDLPIVISYAVTAWMYLTPVVYDISRAPEKLRGLIMAGPVTPVILNVRYALFRQGTPVWGWYFLSLAVSLAVFITGCRVFRRVGRTFLDTI